MKTIILLSTLGCHLCEEAELILAACDLGLFELEVIDIAEHGQWQKQYAVRIPVIYHLDTKKELGWPFTQLDVQALINELSDD